MKKGDIWSIDLPNSSGTEQMGNRPSVIIAEVDANIAIIIPFTSNMQALCYSNTLLVEPSLENGLKSESILLIFQIRAIDKNRIIKKIGILEDTHLEKLDQMLKNMLKLSK
jgi:mRNA interferase MazF